MKRIKIFNRAFTVAVLIIIFRICSYSQEPEKLINRLNFSFSIPLVHNNVLSMPDTLFNNTSFLGITAGVGYYYNNKNFINLLCGGTISSDLPIPIGVDYEGLRTQYNTLFIVLSTNHRISSFLKNKLSYSYGMNYTKYEVLNFLNSSDSTYSTINKSTLGISLGIEYRAIRFFSVGLKLSSSIYNFSQGRFQYNHLAYIDFIFRLGRKDVK